MASDLIIEVCTIDEVKAHPNADKLELAVIKGWTCIVQKGEFKTGDRCVYLPPETMLPEYVSRSLGMYKYLKGSDATNKRIGQVKLRGEPSMGAIVKIAPEWEEKAPWEIGKDCALFLGASKYAPPAIEGVKLGHNCKQHPLFIKYTDIQNLRHFPTAFADGEEVVISEKIHGQAARLGKIAGEWMAGSRSMQKARPSLPVPTGLKKLFSFLRKDKGQNEQKEMELMRIDPFWYIYSMDSVRALIEELSESHNEVIVLGESYGKIQKGFDYDCPKDRRATFRAYDIHVDGHYIDYDEFTRLCDKYGIPRVPELYRGPYSLAKVKELSEGTTTLNEGSHIREGVVVKPVKERRASENRIGRLILKYVSDSYLLSKHHEEGDTTDV